MNVLSSISQLTPVSFICNQGAVWGGKAVVVLSAINPSIVLLTAIAIAAIASAAYFYRMSVQMHLQLKEKNDSLEPLSQSHQKLKELQVMNHDRIMELTHECERLKNAFCNAKNEINHLNAQFQRSIQKNEELTEENAELKEGINTIRQLIEQNVQETASESSSLQNSLSSSLGVSLSQSWIEVSSDSISADLIKNGRLFLTNILYASQEHLDEIIADVRQKKEGPKRVAEILWVLMDIAKGKGEEFEEGSFICKDENGNLSVFLKAFATQRVSSHLKGVAHPEHYGIDVHPTTTYFLPENKKHVLIASIDQPTLGGKRIFIKPENYGVSTSTDVVMHALEYMHSLGRKIAPALAGSDDAANYRKERVPQDLLNEYKEILVEIGKEEFFEDAKKFGVSSMYLVINRFEDELFPQSPGKKVEDFKAKLMAMENPEVRIGREVIIDLTEMYPDSLGNSICRVL